MNTRKQCIIYFGQKIFFSKYKKAYEPDYIKKILTSSESSVVILMNFKIISRIIIESSSWRAGIIFANVKKKKSNTPKSFEFTWKSLIPETVLSNVQILTLQGTYRRTSTNIRERNMLQARYTFVEVCNVSQLPE